MSGTLWFPEPGAEPDLFRPYSLTGGRTRPSRSGLSLAAQVVSAPKAQGSGVDPELQQVLTMCARPTAVAEVAAQTGLPLGVARVLLSDLLDLGLLVMCDNGTGGGRPSMGTLQLVLERIREL